MGVTIGKILANLLNLGIAKVKKDAELAGMEFGEYCDIEMARINAEREARGQAPIGLAGHGKLGMSSDAKWFLPEDVKDEFAYHIVPDRSVTATYGSCIFVDGSGLENESVGISDDRCTFDVKNSEQSTTK